MVQSPSWKVNIHSIRKKYPAFYRIRRFITIYTRTRHWSLFWARWNQSTYSYPIFL